MKSPPISRCYFGEPPRAVFNGSPRLAAVRAKSIAISRGTDSLLSNPLAILLQLKRQLPLRVVSRPLCAALVILRRGSRWPE